MCACMHVCLCVDIIMAWLLQAFELGQPSAVQERVTCVTLSPPPPGLEDKVTEVTGAGSSSSSRTRTGGQSQSNTILVNDNY